MGWIWHLCIANMKQRGIRTALTILGVVIGVISIVSLLALGIGVKNELLSSVMLEGSITDITIYGAMDGSRKDRMLTDSKIKDIAGMDYVDTVYPRLTVDANIAYDKYTSYATLTGVPQAYLDTLVVGAGTLPSENSQKPELLLGINVLDMLYNENTYISYSEAYGPDEQDETRAEDSNEKAWYDLSGEKMEAQIGLGNETVNTRLMITGVTKNISYDTYCNIDVLKKFLRQNMVNGKVAGQPLDKNEQTIRDWVYSGAIVKVDDVEHVDIVLKRLQDKGYEVYNDKEYVDAIQKEVKVIQVLLGCIGMIALIVAVIGIGNTMTTSVYDRIQEIGILKVLGCDPDELLGLFLLESGILGGTGGLIGVLVSYGITGVFVNWLVVKFMGFPKGTHLAVIPLWLSVSAFFFAILLGVLAGLFPAKWASKLRPIDAVAKR